MPFTSDAGGKLLLPVENIHHCITLGTENMAFKSLSSSLERDPAEVLMLVYLKGLTRGESDKDLLWNMLVTDGALKSHPTYGRYG